MGTTMSDFDIMTDSTESRDQKSRAAMSVVIRQIRVRHKTEQLMLGTAGIISKAEAESVGRILGFEKVEAGDVMMHLDNSNPFFMKKDLFEKLYTVLVQAS